jgi:hypothetical protein
MSRTGLGVMLDSRTWFWELFMDLKLSILFLLIGAILGLSDRGDDGKFWRGRKLVRVAIRSRRRRVRR